MNVEFINPFLTATIEVIKTMAFTDTKPGKPFVKKDKIAKGDVSGIIGITGPTNGSMSLSFSKPCILKIVSSMLGEEIKEINEDIADAVGELTNMISGSARNKLGEKGFSFKISIPMIVTGNGHQIKHQCRAPVIAIPFTTDNGPFLVEVSFEN
jgi:chemotaxis protein CheX